MISLPKPETILTHESDLDGLVSGLLLQRLARHVFGVDAVLQAYPNHSWRSRAMTERSAWVCDLSPDARFDRAGWLVVDHHAAGFTPKHAAFLHDPDRCSSVLCYGLCLEHGLDSPGWARLAHLTNVADLFLTEDCEFELASDYANLVKTYQFWNLHALIGGQLERLLDHPLLEVMAVKRRLEDPMGLAWSRERVQELAPQVGYVQTVVGNVNLIVHRLLAEPGGRYPVLVTLFRRGNGTVIASLRSRGGEALAVALRLQGGGHPNAAGATLPRSVQQIPDAVAYLRQVLAPPALRARAGDDLEGAFD